MTKIKAKTLFYISLVLTPLLLSLDDPDQRFFEISKNMEVFASVYAEVNRAYVDDISPNELMKTGLDAMLKSLDPYTNYYPEEDIEDFRFMSTGEYGGIGSMVGNKNGKLMILMPYEGFPAFKAGLKIGDEFIEIDGKNVKGKSTTDVSSLLKGEAGSKVSIKIKRFGHEELLTKELTREKVSIKNVPYYGMLSDKIGYFKLTTFTEDASENVLNAINNLKAKGAEKIIFDLRWNGGGLLREAIEICNFFIPKNKEVVSTRGKLADWNSSYHAPKAPVDTQIPIVILVNERSASASEIVSGVLQDYDRAVLVGNKTYGKGLVQGTMKTAHNTQVKVTVAKYYIPSGRCIQAIDYSKKDKKGNPIKVPDSLLVAFETNNGRKVLDGNGIYPDVEIANDTAPAVLYGLIKDNLLFDYATEYYYTKDSVKSVRDFDITNEYAAFKSWVAAKDFDFEVPSDVALEEFEEVLKKEGVDTKLQEALTELKADLNDSKSDDLDEFDQVIKEQLEKEIVSRYFYKSGEIEADFDDDKDILKAVEILENPALYNQILGN